MNANVGARSKLSILVCVAIAACGDDRDGGVLLTNPDGSTMMILDASVPVPDSGVDAGPACTSASVPNPDCAACVPEGGCCVYSINCQAGSICNVPNEPLYQPSRRPDTCVRVVCQNNADCESGKVCSLEKLCKDALCQADNECAGGTLCLDGRCTAGPDVSNVVSCEVVTRANVVRQGASVVLAAVARNVNGRALPGVSFQWTSSNSARVSVSGNLGTGGAEQGVAMLSARVAGTQIDCTPSVSITNFPNVSAGDVRVVLVDEQTGRPVADAEILLEAGGGFTVSSDSNGAATFSTGAPVESVTAAGAGYELVSVLTPGTNDIFLPLPRRPSHTSAGGFRGVVDMSATRRLDIRIGIVGASIPSNLLNFGADTFERLLGEVVPTVINAPELGLDGTDPTDLQGGFVLSLSNKQFTADATRCQNEPTPPESLGCFLSRAPAGPSAAWAMAGQLRLSDVTSIANELSAVLGGGSGDLPLGAVLGPMMPLLRTMNHAIDPSIVTIESPKVNRPGQVGDCTDANLVDYDDKCQSDYSTFARHDLVASQPQGVLARVAVPSLPSLPGNTACTVGTLLIAGANVVGRGIVPLGLSESKDILEVTEVADCVVAGTPNPFGPASPDLPDGQMPLSMAPPHSGIEGSQLFLLLLALDPDTISGNPDTSQFSALVKRPAGNRVSETEAFSGSFLAFPTGSLNRSAATMTYSAGLGGVTMTRVQITNATGSWYIYAPASTSTVQIPNVIPGRMILSTASGAYLTTMAMDDGYRALWQLGSGKTLDRVLDTIQGFVFQPCSPVPGSACTIQ